MPTTHVDALNHLFTSQQKKRCSREPKQTVQQCTEHHFCCKPAASESCTQAVKTTLFRDALPFPYSDKENADLAVLASPPGVQDRHKNRAPLQCQKSNKRRTRHASINACQRKKYLFLSRTFLHEGKKKKMHKTCFQCLPRGVNTASVQVTSTRRQKNHTNKITLCN